MLWIVWGIVLVAILVGTALVARRQWEASRVHVRDTVRLEATASAPRAPEAPIVRIPEPLWSHERLPLREEVLAEALNLRSVRAAVVLDRDALPATAGECPRMLASVGLAFRQILAAPQRHVMLEDEEGRRFTGLSLGGTLAGEWLVVQSIGMPLPASFHERVMERTEGHARTVNGVSGALRFPVLDTIPAALRDAVERLGLDQVLVIDGGGLALPPATERATPLLPELVALHAWFVAESRVGNLAYPDALVCRARDGRAVALVRVASLGEEWLAYAEFAGAWEPVRDGLRRALVASAWELSNRAKRSRSILRPGAEGPTPMHMKALRPQQGGAL